MKNLIVLVHGLNGSKDDFKRWDEPFKNIFKSDDDILYISSHNEGKTHDGIDTCGERLYEEIISTHKSLFNDECVKLSIVGHSLGGLIAIYAIGKLYESQTDKFIFNKYIALSSPLGGSRRPALSKLSFLVHKTLNYFLDRTGQQLLLEDGSEDEPSLLLTLSDPNKPFYKGLSKFKKRIKYCNAFSDYTVPYCSSALQLKNLYKIYEKDLEMDPNYPHLISTPIHELEEKAKKDEIDYHKPGKTLSKDEKKDEIIEIIKNYRTLEWEDYALKFNHFYFAHVLIIDSSRISRGDDVVKHILENLNKDD